MRCLLLLTLCAAAALGANLAVSPHAAAFAAFKLKHNKKYATVEEDAHRFGVFAANMDKATAYAAANPFASFGAGPFADLTEDEFKPYRSAETYFKNVVAKRRPAPLAKAAAASGQKIDWRQHGAVTPVKNQGAHCGSCWSFSTTGAIEGHWKLAGHSLVALSEQELVSCDHTNGGCRGGLPDDAFTWIVSSRNGTLSGETDFHYLVSQGPLNGGTVPSPACRTGLPPRARITGHQDVASSETAMAQAVYSLGPLSIGVDASIWQNYQGGIMSNCPAGQPDHAVLIVGFDDTHNPPYWIVKNSWTPEWGEAGYVRIAKGSNQCSITIAPSYPVAARAPIPPPAPTPPTPPPAPTPIVPPPTPSGGNGTFEQCQCQGAQCDRSSCFCHSFPTNTCLQVNGGGSAKVTCGASTLHLKEYSSSDCSGWFTDASQPLDQCLPTESGNYVYNSCGSSSTKAPTKKAAFRSLTPKKI